MTTIKFTTVWIVLLLFSLTGASQEHSIKGAEFLKPGQTLPFVSSKALKWADVDSECFEEAPSFGMWVELKNKPTKALS